eukprot:9395021-Pyramimonas_sp.AAC.1
MDFSGLWKQGRETLLSYGSYLVSYAQVLQSRGRLFSVMSWALSFFEAIPSYCCGLFGDALMLKKRPVVRSSDGHVTKA